MPFRPLALAGAAMLWVCSAAAFADPRNTASLRDPAALQRALSTAEPGDTIVLPNGHYQDLRLNFYNRGEEGAPIVLRAETPGQVLITGEVSIQLSGEYLELHGLVFDLAWNRTIVAFDDAQHCRLTGSAFIECGDHRSSFAHVVTFRHGSGHNRVDHCYFESSISMSVGVRNGGPRHEENNFNRIDHNYFHNIQRRFENGQEAIQLGQSTRRVVALHTLVEHNLFEKVDADWEVISNKSAHNTIRFNRLIDCEGELVLRGGTHALVEGNILLGGGGGIRVHSRNHRVINNYLEDCQRGITIASGTHPETDDTRYAAVRHGLVAHNTVINGQDYALLLGHDRKMVGEDAIWIAPPNQNRIMNNLLIASTGPAIVVDASFDNTWSGNLVSGEVPAELVESLGGIRQGDPAMDTIDSLQRPDPMAPGARVARLDEVAHDLTGTTREATTLAGAFGTQTTTLPTPPLVGPKWMAGDPDQVPRRAERKTIPPVHRPVK